MNAEHIYLCRCRLEIKETASRKKEVGIEDTSSLFTLLVFF